MAKVLLHPIGAPVGAPAADPAYQANRDRTMAGAYSPRALTGATARGRQQIRRIAAVVDRAEIVGSKHLTR